MAVTAWFGRYDLSGASEAQRRVVLGVSDLLDKLSPRRLDPADQVVEREGGETWVKLRHDTEPWMEIQFVLSDGWVNFYGVMGHDEAYSTRPGRPDGWEAETIDILADLLQSIFTIKIYTWRGRPWREVRTVSPPYERTWTELTSPAAALPLTRRAVLETTRSASFECRGSRPQST
ncbi:hypothetical protein [uncultured Friedmanniella sp.]|uniref:hypothetical protein n=1 Tax=uncultured Friedmanniella sp. TaxID=335381 RepID=UPI0035CB0FD1